MKEKYKPRDRDQKFGYLIEECGEVLVEAPIGCQEVTVAIGKTLAAVGKSLRWGLDSVNPDLPVSKQEENGEWILRELKKLKKALKFLGEWSEASDKLLGELKDLNRAIEFVEKELKEKNW